ncbi:replication factor A protein 3 [Aaosphaeria arxii CBS 175.79]|uniref:Replication factor A protein 3 n=1 Tax=Aaosphaeria arxii CBS 175.79 TaxID=1450172 RepID=A0A6A5XQ58_9PLEO|nr:replication factor A protein 3 [Aaosphaeria arxii CBS 175.79]KAF2014860.1 replication factor A protein 3 [Aaosphaeria arxii CBS 175.79]
MDHPQTPRVLAKHLEAFQYKLVRVLGRVVQLRGETAVVDAGGSINLILNRDCHLALNHAVEIIGKVDQGLNVKVQAATDFGPNIDFEASNAVVEATHRHKEIFYDDD